MPSDKKLAKKSQPQQAKSGKPSHVAAGAQKSAKKVKQPEPELPSSESDFGEEDEEDVSDFDEEDEMDEEDDEDMNPWSHLMTNVFKWNDISEEKRKLYFKVVSEGRLPKTVAKDNKLEDLQLIAVSYFAGQMFNGGLAQFCYHVQADPFVLVFTINALGAFGAVKHAELLGKTANIVSDLGEAKIDAFIDSEFFENESRELLDKHTNEVYALNKNKDGEDLQEIIKTAVQGMDSMSDEEDDCAEAQ